MISKCFLPPRFPRPSTISLNCADGFRPQRQFQVNKASFFSQAVSKASSSKLSMSAKKETHGSTSSSSSPSNTKRTESSNKTSTNSKNGKAPESRGAEGQTTAFASGSGPVAAAATTSRDTLQFSDLAMSAGSSVSTSSLASDLDKVLHPTSTSAGDSTPPSDIFSDPLQGSMSNSTSGTNDTRQEIVEGTEGSKSHGSRSTHLPRSSHQNFPLPKVPFSTHRFVRSLEKNEIERPIAIELMKVTKALLLKHEEKARDKLLSRQDVENEAYLFSAALSELKTGAQLKIRNDVVALKSMTASLQRETDSVSQILKEDMQRLQSDIQLDMNSRKEETSQQLTALDMKVMSLNSKYTIVMGDVRTEIENARWVIFCRVMGVVIFLALVFSTQYTGALGSPKKGADAKPPPSIEELGVSGGTSEEAEIAPAGWFGWTSSSPATETNETPNTPNSGGSKSSIKRVGESTEDDS